MLIEETAELLARIFSAPYRAARRAARSLGWRLRVLRRRWCIYRRHPMASWSPVCASYKAPDVAGPDGTITPGRELVQRAWRCSRHDKPPPPLKRYDITIDLCR